MLLREIIVKDSLTINGDMPLISATRQMASVLCESAPVFLDNRFLGLFVPRECWSLLVRTSCQKQMVKDFLVKEFRIVGMDTEIDSIIATTCNYFVGVDEKGDYAGHVCKKNLPKGKNIAENILRSGFPRILLDSLPVGVLAIDSKEKIIFVNVTARDILKVNNTDLMGKDIKLVLSKSRLVEALKSGQTKVGTLSVNGDAFITVHCPIKRNGNLFGAVSVFQHAGEFEVIAAELEGMQALAAELNVIFDNSYDGIYITNGDGLTLRVNKAYERITGLKREDLLQKNMKELVARGIISESLTFMIKKTRKPMTITQKIHGTKEILVSGVPVFNKNGQLSRVITNVRDMTELNNIRSQLEKSRKLASLYEQELKKLRASQIEATDFISNSKKMNDTIELALRVAKVDSTVLIQGESGVGKEIIANLIHQHSPRSQTGSFIKINCSAIPSDLLESELFGYEEGAFTGAKKRGKPGMFELADNGTLFLDEIGTISGELQVKLLRVIQFNEIIRLGAVETKKVNIRLLTATSRNLEDLMKENKFREDLYYRLKVVPIRVPPLRERKDDIFPLIVFYLDKFNQKYQLSKRVSSEASEALTMYQWPGNVRELVNLVERLVVTTIDDIIQVQDLPASVTEQGRFSKIVQQAKCESLRSILELVEKETLVHTFKDHRTTRKVGKILKISQSAVMRKVKKHNLQFITGWDT